MVKIKYLQHQEIDKVAWDVFLSASPQRFFYAYSFYLDTISPAWEAIIFFDSNNVWKAIMPIPVRQKLGFKYISQPYFCQQLGIYTNTESVDSQLVEEYLKFLLSKFKYCNRYFINVQIVPDLTDLKTLQCKTHLLDLRQPYQAIFVNFATDRKQNLRRAKNANWQIEESQNIEILIRLHQQHNEMKVVGNNLPFERYLPYIEAVNELIKRNLATVFYAKKEGKIEAGCLFVFAENRIIYLFNGASEIGRKQHARLIIIDEVIKKYANQNSIFDFEDPADAPSVSDYYASFGAQEAAFVSLSWIKFPKWIQALIKIRRWFLK